MSTFPNPMHEILHAHRSIRRFTDDPLPEADLQAAVSAGQQASTSSAVQAYSMIRVRDADRRRRLAEVAGPQEKVARAPALFVICGDVRRHRLAVERVGGEYHAHLEAFLLTVIDASLFAQNFVVALESMGYGVCYIGGLRNDLAAVDEILKLPDGVYPLYGLCAGRPDEAPSARPRLPVNAVFFDEQYPDDASMLATMDAYDAEYEAYLTKRGGTPRGWSTAMASQFSSPGREGIGAYYRSKGADLH
jgi:nitroreductase